MADMAEIAEPGERSGERSAGAAGNPPGAATQLAELAERGKEAIRRTFLQLHTLALGCAVGVTAGLAVGGATWMLWWRGGPLVGENLKVLSSYFPGFTVDPAGAGVGALWGFAAGFIGGFAVAGFRNLALRLVLARLKGSAERFRTRHLLDEV